ncbi:putative EF-hand domain pair protein [Trypoxylus dichotomus]
MMFNLDKASSLIHDSYTKRASKEKLESVFEKYASIDENGRKYMTPEDFVVKFLGLYRSASASSEAVHILASAVDLRKTGRISFEDFQEFEGVLTYCDCMYKLLFRMLDTNADGVISYSEFKTVASKMDLHRKMPFDFNCTLIDVYFGANKERTLSLAQFVKFLHDFHQEHSRQCFRNADKGGTGYITVTDFQNIMLNNRRHLLTPKVESFVRDIHMHEDTRRISFSFYRAFTTLLMNMEGLKRAYMHITKNDRKREVSEGELATSIMVASQLSPLESSILFRMNEILHGKKTMVYNDMNDLSPEHYFRVIETRLQEIKQFVTGERSILMSVLETIYRFSFGFIAGGTGATAVFPVDLVKTRIQNQRTNPSATGAMYKGYIDCFFKVLRNEGFFGLYRGLLPQVIGVSPEKAIKLSINDWVRDKFYDHKGRIKYRYELLAGGCAGFSQVIVTNPLEIIKIRLQTAGEVAGGSKVKARKLIKDLGITGLYKGVRACIVRDVTFASIYFSSYANLKKWFASKDGYNHPLSLLVAGTCAGVPAAALATPADVVKTRIQVIPRAGQTTYNGVIDTVRKVLKEEGPRAFTKGALARVCRSSPQLGITLFIYELLQRFFYVDFGGRASAGSAQALSQRRRLKPSNVDHVGGYAFAVPVFQGLRSKFGISFPHSDGSSPPSQPGPQSTDDD